MSQTCTHIYDTGAVCKSFAVNGQRYCVHHLRHRARRLRMAQAHARGDRFEFNLPPLESMHAVHSALSQLAEAIARGAIESRSARDLLAVLRVASGNFRHPEKWQPNLYESDEPAPDIDIAAEFGLPADLDIDTPPAVAFPAPTNADAPPFSAASAGERVGTDNRQPATDNSLPELPFSGHYCADHQSRECECCRIRPDYPLTPEMVEIVEETETFGPDVAAIRSKQLVRNTERRRLNRERKRYEAIALERNMRRAVEIMTQRKLAESSPSKPAVSACTADHVDQKASLSPTG